jgi:hypothetical protein
VHLPLQGTRPVQGAGGADFGGGAQRVATACGRLLQIAAEEVGGGELCLDGAAAADLPGLDTVQGLADQLGRVAGVTYVAQAAPKVRGEPGFGVEAQPGRLVADAETFVVAFGRQHRSASRAEVAE